MGLNGNRPYLAVLLCETCRCAVPLNVSAEDEATECEWFKNYRHSLRPEANGPCDGPFTWAPDHIQAVAKLAGPNGVAAIMPPGWFTCGSSHDPGSGKLWPKRD